LTRRQSISSQSVIVRCVGVNFGLAIATLCCCQGLAETDLYTTKIAPLLQEKCVACHGPVKSEAGLRLDASKLIRSGAASGSVVDLNNPEESELLQRVTSVNSEERMPPSDAGVALKAEEIELLRQWIVQDCQHPNMKKSSRALPNIGPFAPCSLSQQKRTLPSRHYRWVPSTEFWNAPIKRRTSSLFRKRTSIRCCVA
jgi:hypothetical protein